MVDKMTVTGDGVRQAIYDKARRPSALSKENLFVLDTWEVSYLSCPPSLTDVEKTLSFYVIMSPD